MAVQVEWVWQWNPDPNILELQVDISRQRMSQADSDGAQLAMRAETLSLTEMPNLSIRDLESLNNRELRLFGPASNRIGLCSGTSTTVKPFARRQGDG
jgi:hypothetical protein